MARGIEQRGDEVELAAIEGEQLSAVTFVQDYVQLHFDGPMITAITLPVVVDGSDRFLFGSPEYRDQLCALIGATVVRAYARPAERLQVDFPEGRSVIVSLRPSDHRAVEAAIFSDGGTEQWAVW